jgi:hypothetical protein
VYHKIGALKVYGVRTGEWQALRKSSGPKTKAANEANQFFH